jgi:hypothetical protein
LVDWRHPPACPVPWRVSRIAEGPPPDARARLRVVNAFLTTAVWVLLASLNLLAAPNFSTSSITVDPVAPLEGDVVIFTVAVRNSGDQKSPFTQVSVGLPASSLFIDYAGLEGGEYDEETRRIRGTIAVGAGGENRFTFRVLTLRDSAGSLLVPRVGLSNLYLNVPESYVDSETTIDTRLGTDGVAVGGFRFSPIAIGLLLALALYPVLWLVFGRRVGHGPMLAIVIAVGFGAIFVEMARRDRDSLTTWRETSCVIRNSYLEPSESTSTGTDATGRRRTTTTRTYQTLLMLEYVADGRAMVSTGFDTGSRLSIGGLVGALTEYSRWPPGRTVPCWFDPAHPQDVVVVRGFGGAYVFALLPLLLFAYGIMALRGRRS